MRTILITFIPCLLIIGCKTKRSDKLAPGKIIYHLSRCNGDCPQIDLQIDSNRNLYVVRRYFKNKNEIFTTLSGQFKAILRQKEYNDLVKDLRRYSFSAVEPQSGLMDASEGTVLMYYNGQKRYLIFTQWPDGRGGLNPAFMMLANDKRLERTTEILQMEY